MQPQLMELLRGVHALRPAAAQIHDTHSKDPIQQPAGQVDYSLLASDLRRWTSMVVPFEFKLEDSELPTAVGQLVKRIWHTLQQQQIASGPLLSSSPCRVSKCSSLPGFVAAFSTFKGVAPRWNLYGLCMLSLCIVLFCMCREQMSLRVVAGLVEFWLPVCTHCCCRC